MASHLKRVHDTAAGIIQECGPYARMAALFLAEESRERGDMAQLILWTRVATAIAKSEAGPAAARPLWAAPWATAGHQRLYH